jgi:hypothetical protein
MGGVEFVIVVIFPSARIRTAQLRDFVGDLFNSPCQELNYCRSIQTRLGTEQMYCHKTIKTIQNTPKYSKIPSDKRPTRWFSSAWPLRAHTEREPNVLETRSRGPCSRLNEWARKSSSGIEGCGICKNARLGQFL